MATGQFLVQVSTEHYASKFKTGEVFLAWMGGVCHERYKTLCNICAI